jgi:hypothetical protein
MPSRVTQRQVRPSPCKRSSRHIPRNKKADDKASGSQCTLASPKPKLKELHALIVEVLHHGFIYPSASRPQAPGHRGVAFGTSLRNGLSNKQLEWKWHEAGGPTARRTPRETERINRAESQDKGAQHARATSCRWPSSVQSQSQHSHPVAATHQISRPQHLVSEPPWHPPRR